MEGIAYYARSTPDAVALLFGRQITTFAELDERQTRVAGALSAAGLRTGDRIAVLAPNRPEVVEVTMGALRAGVVPVPVNSLLTPPEVAYLLEDSGAAWLFTDRRVEPLPGLDRVVTFGDAYERLLHDSSPARLAGHVLGRPMHYTSGTTGRPRGVWIEPVPADDAAALSERFRALWGLTSDDVHIVCSPLAHSAPMRYVIRTLEAGGRIVLQKKFDPAETLAAVELFGGTSAFMVPTHLERILRLGERALRRHDLSSMRLLMHAGAPIHAETKLAIMRLFPADSVWEFYSATEGQATRISPVEWLRKRGSVGRALPGAEILILDDDGCRLPPEGVGEVWVHDPTAERFEYWRDPVKTAAAWRGGAFNVGDIGRLDDDGYLYLSGRSHDMIITGGVNVYPQEVEAALAGHPGVLEVAVYGVDDPEWGQEVHAVVVPAPDTDLDPSELRTWAKARLAGYKVPRHVTIAPSLARTPTGKIKREPPTPV